MDANKDCKPCTAGKFCLGGDLTLNPNNQETECPDGLITTFSGAKSRAQCFTKPGYGRVSASGSNGKVTLSGVLCAVGSYNVGSNTAGCQKCGAGLTTASTGSTAAADCSEWLDGHTHLLNRLASSFSAAVAYMQCTVFSHNFEDSALHLPAAPQQWLKQQKQQQCSSMHAYLHTRSCIFC
jgi:hypothetical protein